MSLRLFCVLLLALVAGLCLAQIDDPRHDVRETVPGAPIFRCVVDPNDPDAYQTIEQAIDECTWPGSVIVVKLPDGKGFYEVPLLIE